MMKKKLLLVTAGFPYGESERSFLLPELNQLLTEFDVTVLAMNLTLPVIYPIPEGVRVERWALPPLRSGNTLRMLPKVCAPDVFREMSAAGKGCAEKLAAKRITRLAACWLNALQAKKKLLEIVERDGIDIIYTYWCTDMTVGAVLLKRERPQIKVVTRFHGIDLYEERSSISWQPFRTLLAKEADGLYFPSRMGRDYFLTRWGAECQDKCHVCYLGSPARQRIYPGEGEALHLVSCSNLIPLKRVELIIEGLALLPESVQVAWNHFGDGSERRALEQLAQEKLGTCGNVEWAFRGYVANEELFTCYRTLGAELFITTSSTEGLPVSIMEAFSMGIPAVATAVGGIPELVIDSKTGFLLSSNPDAKTVAGAIMNYLQLSRQQRQELSDGAFAAWRDRFDAGKNALEFVGCLKGLLN